MRFSAATWRWLLASSLLPGAAVHAQAQSAPAATAPRGYEFLTVLVVESVAKDVAKIVVVPAFQGKSEIPLATAQPQYCVPKQLADIVQNTAIVNHLLGDLTAAGWEFLQAYGVPPASGAGGNPVATRYLFRKPRP